MWILMGILLTPTGRCGQGRPQGWPQGRAQRREGHAQVRAQDGEGGEGCSKAYRGAPKFDPISILLGSFNNVQI